MERFGYTLKQARKESSELLQLLAYESWGNKKDEEEQMNEQQRKIEEQGGGD